MSLVEPGLPWSWDACARGWEADPEAGGEHDYWFDEAWIEGTLPSSLRGTLLRNGPGGVQVQGHPLRHPIDGDGLVCKLVFPGDGRVHFRSRFVASRHRQAETEAGRLLYRGQMGTLPADFSRLRASVDTVRLLISGRRSASNRFRNPSNTNAVYWNGKLLTAYETHRPHALDPITLETLGLDDLGGALTPVRNLAAHFREDPRTGHLVTMSARPAVGDDPALVMFSEFDAGWQLVRQQVHHVDGLNYVHDFAMTPHYIIVQMTPFVSVTTSERIRILTGVSSPGESMFHYPASPCRLVVIPRATAPGVHVDDPELAPIHFDDTSAVHIFHFGTAFETSEGLELTAICLPQAFDMRWDHRVWLSNASEAPGVLCRYTLRLPGADAEAGLARVQIDDCSCEFPIVDPRLHGSDQDFVFLMANDRVGENLPYRDIVKCPVSAGGTGQRDVWCSEGIVGEPTFAPREPASDAGDAGWLLVQLYVPGEHRTQFVILDAANVGAGPVCRLHLPHPVPFGFHTTFCAEVLSG